MASGVGERCTGEGHRYLAGERRSGVLCFCGVTDRSLISVVLPVSSPTDMLESVNERCDVEGSGLSVQSLLISKLRNRLLSSTLRCFFPDRRLMRLLSGSVARMECVLRERWTMPSLTLESMRLLADFVLVIRPGAGAGDVAPTSRRSFCPRVVPETSHGSSGGWRHGGGMSV